MLMLGVTLIDGVSTGPRDGAGFESRGPGAENPAPTHPQLSQSESTSERRRREPKILKNVSITCERRRREEKFSGI